MIRTKRERCIREKGEEDFNFYYEKELSIYYFLKGEKLSRKQWKRIDGTEKFNCHEEWKSYIKLKYKDPKVDLEEFRKYLIHRKQRMRPISDFTNPFISAILSAVMTYVITDNSIVNKVGSEKIVEVITWGVVIALILVGFASLIVSCMNIFVSNGLEEIFWSDYQDVITEMIVEKEKQEEKETDFHVIMQTLKDMEEEMKQLHETVNEVKVDLKNVGGVCKKMREKVDKYCDNEKERTQKNRWNQLLKRF